MTQAHTERRIPDSELASLAAERFDGAAVG